MKWSEPIRLTHPIRDVRLRPVASTATTTAIDPAAALRDADAAGYARGQRDAEKRLSEQLLQQRAELIDLQQGILASLEKVVPQLVRETESALVELALEAAKKVVAGIKITEKTVEAVVREAIAGLEDTAEITIHVHPDDLALLRKHKSSLLKESPETGPLRFTGSSDVSRGGCLVQTRFGLLDARRETKFEQLRESLAV